MDRLEFLKKCAILGIALPFLPQLVGCRKEDEFEVNFEGKVLIVGAGAAGLMAGYMLQRYGIDFQIIEASNDYGGRVKRNNTFADFPIDIGAEWIHTSPTIFARLINNKNVEGSVELIPYNPQTIRTWTGDSLRQENWKSRFYGELKFKKTTWYDFFESYIVPSIQDKIILNEAVTSIDYQMDQVLVKTNNNTYTGDKVVLTAPLKILQNRAINFMPPIPEQYLNTIDKVDFPDGIKVFIEFSQRFYPDMVLDRVLSGTNEKIYYDVAFKKDSNAHVLGLFYVGENANDFTDLDDAAILTKVMGELDRMFDGKASRYYRKHIIQNWSAEPYIQGSYSHYAGAEHEDTRAVLTQSINNKVYFAGEAIAERDYSTVHGAGLSGFETIERILEGG